MRFVRTFTTVRRRNVNRAGRTKIFGMTNVSPRDLSFPSSFYTVSFCFLFSPHLFFILSLFFHTHTHTRIHTSSVLRRFLRFLPPEYRPILPGCLLFVSLSVSLRHRVDCFILERGSISESSI